jgi:hypothetical protein
MTVKDRVNLLRANGIDAKLVNVTVTEDEPVTSGAE